MKSDPQLGSLAAPTSSRDAVHIAILPMLATRVMQPGERLQNGIVDPFLSAPVQPGEWYYLCLFPNTVTSLRHVWTHPAFANEPEPARKHRSEADVWAGCQSQSYAKENA